MKLKWDYEEGAAEEFEFYSYHSDPISVLQDYVQQFIILNPRREGSLYDYAYIFVACDTAYFRVDPVTLKINELKVEESGS